MSEKRKPHRRPTAAEMDERVNIEHDAAEAVIEALLKVDPDAPVAQEPARERDND